MLVFCSLIAHAAYAINYVVEVGGDQIQAVIDAGCVTSLIRLLDHTENVMMPSLNSIGNIVCGNDSQV